MKNSIARIGLFFASLHQTVGQHEGVESLDFERVIENILPQQEFDLDYNDLYDRLFTLYTNPLDLNSAKRGDFQSLFFLSEDQINGIVEYRKTFGRFLSVYELQSIDGFDREALKQLSPFITVRSDLKESLKSGLTDPDIHHLFLRYQTVLENKKGYTSPDTLSSGKLTSRYVGDPNRLYSRYLFSKTGMYSFGFTIEKDPGEQLVWDPGTSRYGMDYYSFHAMVEQIGILNKAVIGDFSLDFGQGLIFGSGFNFGKGIESVTTVRRNNLGLVPYRSVFEDRNFSGVAISTTCKALDLCVFASRVRRDAIIRKDTVELTNPFFTAIQTTGLHRTTSEIAAKNKVVDRSIGGNINYKVVNGKLELGLNGIFTSYSVPQKPSMRKYNQFDFRGSRNYAASVYFNYYLRGAHIFSEAGMCQSKGKAVSTGIIASLSPQVQASFHYRNYQRNFHSFYGAAFGENTKIANEHGFYWGVKIFPIRKMTVTSYIDLFQFPWLKYGVDKPSRGRDFMLSSDYQFNSRLNMRVRFRSKTKEENISEKMLSLVRIVPKKTNRLLFNLNFELNEKYSIQTRVQQSRMHVDGNVRMGFLIAQDVNFQMPALSISARFSLFDAESYDTRQFVYERDLLYVYSVPSFYNQGSRFYFLTKLSIFKNIEFWFKISQTKYFDQNQIGSGLEEIDGNTKTNLNVQVRLKL
ncbi:MAG: helix-hairpin-helix domain-containing protein [Cytophagales bacterium]|nr:helix-hairpin-helix domain-containing protein [Cytophagales bacterium]